MGIGTSLGAYFESPFHQEAGIDTPPDIVKPKDTGDDNVLPPDSESQTKSAAPQPVADMKTASPLVTITDEDIEKGINLGLSFSGGGLSLKKGAPPPEPMGEGPDVFQQFMASRGSRQPSNIVDAPGTGHPLDPVEAADLYHNLPEGRNIRFAHEYEGSASPSQWNVYEDAVNDHLRQVPFIDQTHAYNRSLQGIHPDNMHDADFYHWGEYQPESGMAAHQEARWLRLDEEAAAAHGGRPYTGTEADLYHPDPFSEAQSATFGQRAAEAAKKAFEAAPPDQIKNSGNISLMKTGDYGLAGNGRNYNFLSKDGVPGELGLRYKPDQKDIYVNWIGTIAGTGVNAVGKAEMKDLFKLVAGEFPEAKTITGFRVSGARQETGRGSSIASMKIPGR